MRVEVMIDGLTHQISTRDPVTLGRWLAEVLTRPDRNPATFAQVRVWPEFGPGPAGRGTAPDWIADGSVIGHDFQVRSPREFVEALAAQVDEYEGRPDAQV
jgi:hypothetical protein